MSNNEKTLDKTCEKFDLKDYLRKKWKNIIRMLVGVFVMGMGIAVLNITELGPDPCSALHYVMSDITGMTFGTYQLCVNAVLFLYVFFKDKTLLGPGTLGNMVIVGYSADFTSWLIKQLFGEVSFGSVWARVAVMLPALAIFMVAAAVYMNSETGTAPYDALSYFIHNKLQKSGMKIPFRIVRIVYDLVVMLMSVAVCLIFRHKMTSGIVTVLMVFALGPVIDLIAKLMKGGKKTADNK